MPSEFLAGLQEKFKCLEVQKMIPSSAPKSQKEGGDSLKAVGNGNPTPKRNVQTLFVKTEGEVSFFVDQKPPFLGVEIGKSFFMSLLSSGSRPPFALVNQKGAVHFTFSLPKNSETFFSFLEKNPDASLESSLDPVSLSERILIDMLVYPQDNEMMDEVLV